MSIRITTSAEQERAVAEAYASAWWLWLVAGILWLLLGFVVLSLRPVSISVCVILIAVARGSPRKLARFGNALSMR